MNKRMSVIILIIGLIVFLFMTLWIGLTLKLGFVQNKTQEILIESSISPDEKYTLEAYRTEPGATVDFSIKVYIKTDSKNKLIYNAYHENEAEIEWIDDSKVSINGKTLDLSQNETFDWRSN